MKKFLFALSALACLFLAGFFAAAAQPLPCPTGGFFSGPELPALGLGGLVLNQASISALFTAFKTNFQTGFKGVAPLWQRIATLVPSSTRSNTYAWLGDWPQLREWIGDRHLKGLASHDYAITNRKFESTVAVPRDDIDDDQYGIYAPRFTGMGKAAAEHPELLLWPMLNAGFASLCYDGQNFFDTDHPVGEGVVSNSGGGAGTPWFLLDVNQALKPLLFQKRRDYDFKSMTKMDDEAVFMRDEYRYGVDARVAGGYGFWQMAFGSKQTLDKAAYAAAREGMMSLKSDEGSPLGIMPRLLVVPPSLESKGLEILNAERDTGGATNVYKGTAELLVVPWLA